MTYEVTIYTYTKTSSTSADRDSLTLTVRDTNGGTLPIITKDVGRTGEMVLPRDVKQNTYQTTISLPARSVYILGMSDPNRIQDIKNMNNSIGVPFYLEDTMFIKNQLTIGNNSSPILFNPPIDYASIGDSFFHNPAAYDPDGDSLVFFLIPPKQDPNLPVPGYDYPDIFGGTGSGGAFPNVVTLDRATGEFIWAMPRQAGIYNIAIQIQEWRNGCKLSTMIRDMQIIVEDFDNDPPVIVPLKDTCIVAGTRLRLDVQASDPNAPQITTLFAFGGPLEITNSPATFNSTSGLIANGVFDWQTNCDHARSQFYEVVFKAEDNYQEGGVPIPLVDIETYIIRVIAPPPENLNATVTSTQVDLTWNGPYACETSSKFRGFSVWRKLGCDSIIVDTCQTKPRTLGYTRIADGLTTYAYTDMAVSPGNIYSYRVTADFAESTPAGTDYDPFGSTLSNEVCVELKRSVPILTNVSVQSTDLTTGDIYVRWLKPDPIDLDTVLNPGPYRYELFNLSTSTVVNTVNTPFFGNPADSFFFVETALNTEATQYAYQVNFFATIGGTLTSLGSSPSASSIFLNTTALDNAIDLDWSENVPWVNFRYDVYRETFPSSGVWTFLDSTTEQQYIDENLVNGTEYCYRVRSFGRYTGMSLPDTLKNLSQESCDTPVDTFPPCPPVLSVTNACIDETLPDIDPDKIENYLNWTNPNLTCADDVVKYNLYVSNGPQDTLSFLIDVDPATDTSYLHLSDESFSVCYAVSAVDSFGNESPLSNLVCPEICPQFELPNTFTPNGDGQNDAFTPILPYRFIDRVDFKVYNRWGALVYETSEAKIAWDGKSINSGSDLPDGVYYYVCDVFESTNQGVVQRPEVLKGWIHLIRGAQ